MYRDICSFLEGRGQLCFDSDGNQADRKDTVAVAAVLWQMARIDGQFDRREFDQIIFCLDRTLDLMDGEAAGLLEIAQVLNARPERLGQLVDQLIGSYSQDQRTIIFDTACRVAEADGVVLVCEERFENALAAKFGIVAPVPKNPKNRKK